MLLFLHFGQGQLQVIDVSFEGGICLPGSSSWQPVQNSSPPPLQPLVQLLHFGLQLNLAFDESLTPALGIHQVFCFLKTRQIIVFSNLFFEG